MLLKKLMWCGMVSLTVLLLLLVGNTPAVAAPQVNIKQVDANSFPFVFLTAEVSEGGVPVGDLTAADFSVSEDGRNQTNYFDVTPPEQSGGVRLVDFVFLIDNSGSMGDKIAAVRNNTNAFANLMAASGIDLRLGAMRFGQSADGGAPQIFNSGNLTGDLSVFHSWINQMYASGGFEPGLQAVINAANTFNFRPGSQRHFLLITDEDSDGGSLSQAISICNSNNIVVHGAISCGFGSSYAHYCNPTSSITGATGGLVFSVVGPYDAILNELGEVISNTYIVRYRTDNPAYDGQQRTVALQVTTVYGSGTDIAYYTPGAGPRISRTQPTIDLSQTAQVAGQTLTIAATITDEVLPGVASSRLYYRLAGGSAYTPVLMNSAGGNNYAAAIQAASVTSPGVQYYITATDGQTTSSAPAVEPGSNPYNIAVLPNVAPQLTHTPVANAGANTDIPVTVSAVDNTNHIASVTLAYKKTGTLLYSQVSMTYASGTTYSATIPRTAATTDGVEYYIRATDNLGVATDHGPHHITISGMTAYIAEKISLAQHILNTSRPPTFWETNPIFQSIELQALEFATDVSHANTAGTVDALDVQGVARLALSERVTKQAVSDAGELSVYAGKGMASIAVTIVLSKACKWLAEHVRKAPWIGKWAAAALTKVEKSIDSGTRKLIQAFNGNFKTTLVPLAKQQIAEKISQDLLAGAVEGTVEETGDFLEDKVFNTGLFDKAENAFGSIPLGIFEKLSEGDQQLAVSWARDHVFEAQDFEQAKADATLVLQTMTADNADALRDSKFFDTLSNYAAITALIASLVAVVVGFFVSGGILSLVAGAAALLSTIATYTTVGSAIAEAARAGIYVAAVMPTNYVSPSVYAAFGSTPSLTTDQAQPEARNLLLAASSASAAFSMTSPTASHFDQVSAYYARLRSRVLAGSDSWHTVGLDSLDYYQTLAAQDQEQAIADFLAAADSAEAVLPTFQANCNQFLAWSASGDFFSASLYLYAIPAKYGLASEGYIDQLVATLDSCLARYTLLTALGDAMYDSLVAYSLPIPPSVSIGAIDWTLTNPQLKQVRLETSVVNHGNTEAMYVLVQPSVNAQSGTIVGDTVRVVSVGPKDTVSVTFDLRLSDSTCSGVIAAAPTDQSNVFHVSSGRHFTVDLRGFAYEVNSMLAPYPWNLNWVKTKGTVQAIITGFPGGYKPTDIVPSSVRLNGTVPLSGRLKIDLLDGPKAIASFERRATLSTLGTPVRPGIYRSVVTGTFADGTHFITDAEMKIVP